MESRRQRRQAQLEHLRRDPDRVPPGSVECERHEPERDAHAVPASVEASERPRLGNGAPGSRIEREHDRAEDDVCERERRCVDAVRDVVDQGRHRRNRQHRAEVRKPEGQVVGVEPGGVGHVALPGDVDRKEERGEPEEAACGMVDY